MQTIPNPTIGQRSAFASRIAGIRDAVVEQIFRSSGVARRTLFVEMIAHQFIDYLETSAGEVGDESLILWAKSLLRGHQHPESIVKVLLTGIPATQQVLDRLNIDYWLIKPDLQQMHNNIVLLTSTLSSGEKRGQANTVDPIDAHIDDLITKLDAEDPATAEHSRSVSLWCARIAKRMRFNRQESILVTRGGLIHDIGKITTPKEILNAPRALDEREWGIMKHHVVAGVEIIDKVPQLRHLIAGVRGHHERFDGKGYPDKKQGTNIDLFARVITVADAFNAMIARRAYRLPFSPLVALEELKRHRATQFDPRIVEAMTDVVVYQDE